MSQVQRNQAARLLFDEMGRRYKDLDRNWLREQINAIVLEELRHVRADFISEARRHRHFHAAMAGNLEDELVTLSPILARIDRRMKGENT